MTATSVQTELARVSGALREMGTDSAVLARNDTAHLVASGGNLLVARDAGGWASTAVVDEIYAHVDLHDPPFDAALRKVWGLA